MDNNIINRKRYVLIGLMVVLLAGNILFIARSASLSSKLSDAEARIEKSEKNEKIADFFNLFVEKILKSQTEVDFDTRLEIENAVRTTKDEELLAQWQKFTSCKTEESAQVEVKNLLGMIANKIK